MNGAIIRKLIRDSLPLFAIVIIGVLVLETLIVGVFTELADDLQTVLLGTAFIRRFVTTILGAEIGDQLSVTGMMAFGFAHPVLYALTWAFMITTVTRELVGQIERGTFDLVLTLPVSRLSVYNSVTVVWLAAIVALSVAPLLGTWAGHWFFDVKESADFVRLAVVSVNLFALNVAIGGGVMLASSVCNRRGIAIGVVLGMLLGSFVLNFLATLSQTARHVSALGVLHYYRPLVVIRESGWPWWDMSVLVGAGIICWVIGAWRFAIRDIHAV